MVCTCGGFNSTFCCGIELQGLLSLNEDVFILSEQAFTSWIFEQDEMFFLALGLLCSLFVPTAVMAQSPILSALEINYPPFCFVDDDSRAGGFSVELMRAALASMGRTVTFRTGPWAEVRGWLER